MLSRILRCCYMHWDHAQRPASSHTTPIYRDKQHIGTNECVTMFVIIVIIAHQANRAAFGRPVAVASSAPRIHTSLKEIPSSLRDEWDEWDERYERGERGECSMHVGTCLDIAEQQLDLLQHTTNIYTRVTCMTCVWRRGKEDAACVFSYGVRRTWEQTLTRTLRTSGFARRSRACRGLFRDLVAISIWQICEWHPSTSHHSTYTLVRHLWFPDEIENHQSRSILFYTHWIIMVNDDGIMCYRCWHSPTQYPCWTCTNSIIWHK